MAIIFYIMVDNVIAVFCSIVLKAILTTFFSVLHMGKQTIRWVCFLLSCSVTVQENKDFQPPLCPQKEGAAYLYIMKSWDVFLFLLSVFYRLGKDLSLIKLQSQFWFESNLENGKQS
jgi:hypothetical protein